jgi:transposase
LPTYVATTAPAIRLACRQFVLLCRELGLFEQALVAIDGS